MGTAQKKKVFAALLMALLLTVAFEAVRSQQVCYQSTPMNCQQPKMPDLAKCPDTNCNRTPMPTQIGRASCRERV